MRRRLDAAGYAEVKTPQLMDVRQWERSGHWGKYSENMFAVPDEVPQADSAWLAPGLIWGHGPARWRPLWLSSSSPSLRSASFSPLP